MTQDQCIMTNSYCIMTSVIDVLEHDILINGLYQSKQTLRHSPIVILWVVESGLCDSAPSCSETLLVFFLVPGFFKWV